MLNPNGCSAKGTFFVSHKYTNYSAVQEYHRKGHEIGVFSITRKQEPKYWSKGTYDDWLAEMAGDRLIMERFANITDGSVIGIRAPYLRIGGNTQFQMMNDQFFVYDSSITAPLSRVPGLNLFIACFLSIFPILWQLLIPIMRIITKDEQ